MRQDQGAYVRRRTPAEETVQAVGNILPNCVLRQRHYVNIGKNQRLGWRTATWQQPMWLGHTLANAEMNDYVLMRLEGEDVDLMCDVNPPYKAYVRRSRKWEENTVSTPSQGPIQVCSKHVIVVRVVFVHIETNGF